ncbi:MAG: CoA-binding protein [Leptospirillia bacterium]
MSDKSIVIIGASSNRAKFGNKAVRAFTDAGFTVYAVHPKETEVEGLKVYRSVADLPETPDYASLYLPPKVGEAVLDDIAAKGIKQVFANPGAESPELLEKGKKLGLEVMAACSIVAAGKTPMDYPDQ